MGANTLPLLFAVICSVSIIAVLLKRRCLFRGIFASVVQGVAALYAVNLIGMAIGIKLAVNWYTLGTAAVLGSPGVALALVVQAVLKA